MTVFESLADPVFPIEMIVNPVGDKNQNFGKQMLVF